MKQRILIAATLILYALAAVALVWGYLLNGGTALKIAGLVILVVGAVVNIRDVKDIVTAFEMDIHKEMGKTIMVWDEVR